MSYYFKKTLEKDIRETRMYIENQLKEAGFGIVSEIDLSGKFKEKLNVDFRPYLILGACSPKHAHLAVSAEENIGLMLPCNVVLQEKEKGKTQVSVIDPVASMQAVHNENLGPVAAEIREKLQEFVTSLK